MKPFLKELFFVRNYLFPGTCPCCGEGLRGREEAWYGLCSRCAEGFRYERGGRCDCCGRPLISEIKRCLFCRELFEAPEKPAWDRLAVIFPYGGKYRKLLASYKFSGNIALGHFFVELLAEALKSLDLEGESVWVPVPPRPGKLRHNGWDQIEYLARLLEKESRERSAALPLARCLKRLPSKSQKELNRENRRTNLRGKILAKGKVPAIAVIFDDVITTGSTIDACATALKSAGAEKVYGISLFY